MPCIRLFKDTIVCVRNEPVSVKYRGKTYRFEWHSYSGWMPVNKNGDERLSPVPNGAWKIIEAAEKGGDDV